MALLAGAALIGIAIPTGLNHRLIGEVFEDANYNSVNTVPSLLASATSAKSPVCACVWTGMS